MHKPLRIEAHAPQRAIAEASARIHLGFLDPSASLGRRFASLGMTVEGFSACVEALPAQENRIELRCNAKPATAARLGDYLDRLQAETGATHPLHVVLHRVAPTHTGLGSGTQLALAFGQAFAHSHALALDSRHIAHLLGRGERSGVGIAGFETGGLLLDGGPGPQGSPAPLLARVEVPAEWRIVLIMDGAKEGLHGKAERAAIESMPAFPRALAAELCHLTLMVLLPALAERNFLPFADAVSRIQRRIGDYYAPAQGGSMFASADVGRAIEWIGARHAAAIGQSSWGPTGFAIMRSAAEAERALAEARASGALASGLDVRVVRARNQGGRVRTGADVVHLG